ncbi:MAG: VWA domain-containing protein [Pseudomonadota bacterium]
MTFQFREKPFIHVFTDVVDSSGKAVIGLTEKNFQIRVGGGEPVKEPFRVMPFAASEKDLSYVILLDRSRDLAASLTLIKKGAACFLNNIGFRYKGALMVYTDEPAVLTGPTSNHSRLLQALNEITPGPGQVRLFDGLLAGTTILEKTAAGEDSPVFRQALVLLTEGLDQGSQFSMDAAKAKILETGASLFVLGYGEGQGEIWRELKWLAEKSGGAFFNTGPEEFEANLAAVADRLRFQYVVTCPVDHEDWPASAARINVAVGTGGRRGEGTVEFTAPFFPRHEFSFGERHLMPGLFLLGAVVLVAVALAIRGSVRL